MELIKLKTTNKAKPTPKPKTNHKAQRRVGLAMGSCALVCLALSLTHLAEGIALMGVPHWQGWALAIVIDFGFVCLEAAIMACPGNKRVQKWAGWTIPAMLTGSAGLNALAFAWNATGWFVYPAIAFGIAIPALVYVFAQVVGSVAMEK